MHAHARAYAARHPFKTGFWCAVLALLTIAAVIHAVNVARWWVFSQRFEEAAHAPVSGAPAEVTWPVLYRGGLFKVTVHVYPSEIEAGRQLDTAWVFGSGGSVRARYVRSLVRTQAESRLVGELAAELRGIRHRLALSDDEYLELMMRTVQDIPYGQIGDEIAMPAEVVTNGQGVCTEKSVLLGALMVHEGWDTTLIVLEGKDHVALGVRSDGPRFRDLPYAYIETTRSAALGECANEYLGWGPIGDRPTVIELGGHKRYIGPSPASAPTSPPRTSSG